MPEEIDLIFRNIVDPKVMSIINATPDSFYSGSHNSTEDQLYKSITCAVNDGAEIIDIGGYSSRPSADDVPVEEEIRRIIQATKIVREINKTIPVSIDTFRSEVVKAVLDSVGRVIVNDISAGEMDPNMIRTVSENKLPYIAMHMRGTPKTMQSRCEYGNLVADIFSYFMDKIVELRNAGVTNVAIDPGFGFSKTADQNFMLLRDLNKLNYFGVPILVGISRKSMIYKTLDITPEQALNGTTALHWQALSQGAAILRVHDTKEAVETVKLYKKIQSSI